MPLQMLSLLYSSYWHEPHVDILCMAKWKLAWYKVFYYSVHNIRPNSNKTSRKILVQFCGPEATVQCCKAFGSHVNSSHKSKANCSCHSKTHLVFPHTRMTTADNCSMKLRFAPSRNVLNTKPDVPFTPPISLLLLLYRSDPIRAQALTQMPHTPLPIAAKKMPHTSLLLIAHIIDTSCQGHDKVCMQTEEINVSLGTCIWDPTYQGNRGKL